MEIKPPPKAVSKTLLYLDILFEANKRTNLIGTKEKDQIFLRHFLDSLSILAHKERFFLGSYRLIDIGSGGGLPGLLLSLFLPDKKVCLMDKSSKKIDFLNRAIDTLCLENVVALRGRAEQLAKDKKHREAYDIVLARAVTDFSILLELVIPFSKINGKIIFYKSLRVFEEIDKNKDFIKLLGGEIVGLHEANIPDFTEFRVFLEVRKKFLTSPGYPRKFAKIKREPGKPI